MKSADANSYEKSLRDNGVVPCDQHLVIHIIKQPEQVLILRSSDYFQNLIVHLFIIFYHSCDFLYGTLNSSVDRRHFDAYPDPTYRFDNDPDQDPIASFTNVGKSDLFLLLFSLAYSVL
jgi:hypothetical protein